MEEIEKARKHIQYFEKCFDIISDDEDIYGNVFELASEEQMDNFEKFYDILWDLKSQEEKRLQKLEQERLKMVV